METFNRIRSDKNKKGLSKNMVFVIVLLISITTILIISSFQKENTNNDISTHSSKRSVTVMNAISGEYPSKVNLLGEVVPEWQSEIKSQVNGLIKFISPKLRVGSKVSKGELLLKIENSEYTSLLAEAQTRLSNAKLRLLNEEKEAETALENWKRSGMEGEPLSPLVLRKPQLKVARDEFEAAKSALIAAETNLSYTIVKAPFNGIIVERNVNMGEAISMGYPILKLFSIDKAIVEVSLSNKEYHLLSGKLNAIKAVLKDPDTKDTWSAKVVRKGNHFDKATRMRSIMLEIDHPIDLNPPLLAGQFLTVELTGENINNLLKLPESALTNGGFIWYVNNERTLQSFKASPKFYLNGYIYTSLPESISSPLQIAINPNSSFLNGTAVNPILKEGE